MMFAQAKPKRQRLMLALIAGVVLLLAAGIALFALRDTAAYFKSPADLLSAPPLPGQSVRLGGLVKAGSVHRSADGTFLYFTVTDTVADRDVAYRGLVPDLFREGQGVIATGSLDNNGRFLATELLAKHDENYMPPEVAKSLAEKGHKTSGA